MQTLFALRKIPQQWKDNTFGLEFECQYPDYEIRQELLYKYHGFFYMTSDGSLNWEYGVELVSQPLALPVLIKQLQKMKKKMSEVRADQNGAIHIHVARSAKNLKAVEQLLPVLDMVGMELFHKFAGRFPNDYCRVHWSLARYHTDRYSWINLTNTQTIEFRGFSNKNSYFGWDWAIIALQRTNYLLNNPTVEGMREAIKLFPWNPEQPVVTRITSSFGDILRTRLNQQ